MESKELSTRNWALKCGITFGMLHGELALEVYNQICIQFNQHQNNLIWTTSIKGTFDLFERYGFVYFQMEGAHGIVGGADDKENGNSKRKRRQLYSKLKDQIDEGENSSQSSKSRILISFIVFSQFLFHLSL